MTIWSTTSTINDTAQVVEQAIDALRTAFGPDPRLSEQRLLDNLLEARRVLNAIADRVRNTDIGNADFETNWIS